MTPQLCQACRDDWAAVEHSAGAGIFGLRWRVKKEVIAAKGQLTCGECTCTSQERLASYELPFSYKEAGQQRTALVKVCALRGQDKRLHLYSQPGWLLR